jgi:hypothetical protein
MRLRGILWEDGWNEAAMILNLPMVDLLERIQAGRLNISSASGMITNSAIPAWKRIS